MQHAEALKRIQTLFRRAESLPSTDVLSGPSLIDQEPDLMRETARYNKDASAWAAGHSTD